MSAVKVLVVDDSGAVRRIVATVLSEDPSIEVVGQAANGQLALDQLESTCPDLVTLDIEMPVMDGLTTLRELRRRDPRLPVIMFSTLTEAGAAATLDALAAGASDYVTKPSNAATLPEALDQVRAQLVPKVRALGGKIADPFALVPDELPDRPSRPSLRMPPVAAGGADGLLPGAGADGSAAGEPPAGVPAGPAAFPAPRTAPAVAVPAGLRAPAGGAGAAPARTRPSRLPASPVAGGRRAPDPAAAPGREPSRERTRTARAAAAPRRVVPRRPPAARPDVLAVGCSTGGPDALAAVLAALPADLPVPVVIVQHMPPVFTRLFAQRLDRSSALRVHEAEAGERLVPGTALLAPGDYHLTVVREGVEVVAALDQRPPENFCRPSVDVLFRSVAAVYGAAALALVLTGMGHDGRSGAEDLVEAGSLVLAQDEATSVVWGMPGAVAQAGLATDVLALDAIPGALMSRLTGTRRPGAPAAGRPTATAPAGARPTKEEVRTR